MLLWMTLACSSGTTQLGDDSQSQDSQVQDSGSDDSGSDDTGADDTGADDTGDTGDTGEPAPHPTEPPTWPAYSGGVCPTLAWGNTSEAALNSGFVTGEGSRDFRVLVPSSYDGATPMPMMFAFHWLNASSNSFVSQGELETAVEQLGMIAVLPDSDGDSFLFDWPFAEEWGQEAEILFLHDMMACVDDQFNIDHSQVHAVGVSAGALWVTYLSTTAESDYFASVMSLSGGLGDAFGFWQINYAPQPRKFPVLALNGGPSDQLGLDFHQATKDYRDALRADGHFVVYCEHDSGHTMPPIEPPEEGTTKFHFLWSFMLDHPYGLQAGDSPYLDSGLPSSSPEWCEIAP